MSYTIDHGYTRPVATINLALPSFDKSVWKAREWTTKNPKALDKNQKRQEFVYVDASSPTDRDTVLRLWSGKVPNIYDRYSDIAPINKINQSPVTAGVQFGGSLTNTDRISDGVSPTDIYMPKSISLNVVCGLHEAITATELKASVCDLIDQMFPTGSVSANQIALLAKGSFDYLDETP